MACQLISDQIKTVHYGAAVVVDGRRRPIGVVTRSDLVRPTPRRVLLVDHAEQAQSVLGVGEAEIVVNGDVGRCVVTSHDPDRGVTDLDTLGTLALYRREGQTEPLPFGVYAGVTTPGRVSVGDTVSVRS